MDVACAIAVRDRGEPSSAAVPDVHVVVSSDERTVRAGNADAPGCDAVPPEGHRAPARRWPTEVPAGGHRIRAVVRPAKAASGVVLLGPTPLLQAVLLIVECVSRVPSAHCDLRGVLDGSEALLVQPSDLLSGIAITTSR